MVNYHCHSHLSEDGHSSMTEMAQAAWAAGVTQLCFTDHCDLLSPYTGEPSDTYDWEAEEREFRAAQAAVPEMELRLGVELGNAVQDTAHAAEVLRYPKIDFVIGSIHNPPMQPDYDFISCRDNAHASAILDDYLQQELLLAQSPYYDVLGHLDYPVRYLHYRDGFDVQLRDCELVREILTTVIRSGRGIECNTSGYRTGSWTYPDIPILKLYRELGGEILTLGSDAHKIEHITLGLRESITMLRELGFRFYTTYTGRHPTQHRLEDLL